MGTKKMGRPKGITERKNCNTTLSLEVLRVLKDESEKTGIPMNRLIENAVLEKYKAGDGA